PALAHEFAHPHGFSWTDRKGKQWCAAFRESPPVVTPCVDPLSAILKARILGEGIDGARCSALHERPLETRRILTRKHQVALELHLRDLRRICFVEAHYLCDDAFRRCRPAPHSKR